MTKGQWKASGPVLVLPTLFLVKQGLSVNLDVGYQP